MSDELNKRGKSGDIIGLTSEQRERIARLSREQMIKVIESFYVSGNAITANFTYLVGGEVLGDKNRITDDMLGSLQLSINLMWNEIIGAEIERMKRQQDNS